MGAKEIMIIIGTEGEGGDYRPSARTVGVG